MPDLRSSLAIPRTIWALGLVSLFMDLSSELVHSLLPVFMISTLGASMLTVGLIEGVAEATSLIVKVFSGPLSDYFGHRKGLILLGYGMSALTKPLFPLASSIETVFTARLLDRIGKGIRGAPRDALVADFAPAAIRGACFGLRQSMDTIGALTGPLLAILLMYWFSNDIKLVLWFAVVPAVIAVVVIVAGVRDREGESSTPHLRSPIRVNTLMQFSGDYWWVVGLGSMFTLARFSEAFLVLRAHELGFSMTWVPIVLLVMSLFYALSAYPAGVVSDRVNRKWMLMVGLVSLVVADVVLAQADAGFIVLIGAALWGLHMGFSQGILATMIADATPPGLKGTAFGLFNLASGLCMLLASVIAGLLWDFYGATSTFYAGATFSLVAVTMLAVHQPASSSATR